MKSTGRCASSRRGSRPGAEMLEREAEAVAAQAGGEVGRVGEILRRDLLADLEHDALRLDARRLQLVLQPRQQRLVAHRILRQAHEQQVDLAAGAERHRCADDPAVDVLHQVVALGGRHELRRQHFLALLVDHAHQHVEHAAVLAHQARDRLLHQSEAVLHQRRADVAHPDLVRGLLARVLVLRVDDRHAGCRRLLRRCAARSARR